MYAWDFWQAPVTARRGGAVALVHTASSGGATRGLPSVLVLHDTMVLDHPGLFDRRFVAYAGLAYGRSVRAASLVVTCSEHSADRIRARWPHADPRVIPWPSYAEPTERPWSPASSQVLVVSAADKHKRLELAVEAVDRCRRGGWPELGLTLVVKDGNGSPALADAVGRLDPDGAWVTRLSAVTDERLSELYAGSLCLMVPSLDEGYCLPAIEATTHGIPVLHLNRGALPEVVPRPEVGQPLGVAREVESLAEQLVMLRSEDRWRRWRNDAAAHCEGRASRAQFTRAWLAAIGGVTS